MARLHSKLSYTQMILLSFLLIIFVGSLLLCLPFASRSGEWTPFVDAFFTATSATCVTGLVVYDTYTYWTGFGQAVILLLIQMGGLGLMTCIAMFFMLMGKRITLSERRLLMQSAGSMQIGGIVRLIQLILRCTVIFEGLGFIILSFVFCPKFGFWNGLWSALFHSVSAFCNAGFDLLGRYGEFSSLAGSEFAMNPVVNLTIMGLIVAGGIGFFVWDDIIDHRGKFEKYKLHSKIVLVTTGTLIVVGTILFFIFENSSSLKELSFGDKLLASLFQSVTPRTAGFNTVNMSAMSNAGSILIMLLMFIGASPGSTGGGIKTTTFFVLLLGAVTSARRYGNITVFKRKIDSSAISEASAVATIFFVCLSIAIMIISAIEPFSLKEIMFECISAIDTVGLTIGITPHLSTISRIVLIVLMYAGRIGGLSLMLVLADRNRDVPVARPVEKIMIG